MYELKDDCPWTVKNVLEDKRCTIMVSKIKNLNLDKSRIYYYEEKR